MSIGNGARIGLAAIRLTNGLIALIAPQIITSRFAAPGEPPPAPAVYALRMFGIRTILVAIDLMRPPGLVRTHAMRSAPLIHASDLLTAILISRSPRVSAGTGIIISGISALNTVLALLAYRASRSDPVSGSHASPQSPRAGTLSPGAGSGDRRPL